MISEWLKAREDTLAEVIASQNIINMKITSR